MSEPYALELDGVTKVYGERRAVDGLTMRVPVGSFLGLLGRNGAGKSTTLRLLTGLTRPTSGSVRVFGQEVVGDAVAIKRQLGVMPEDMALLDLLTGPEYLRFVGRMHGRALQDDQLPRRAGHRDVTVHRSLDAGAEALRIDQDDEVELKALRQLRREREHAVRGRVRGIADDAGDSFGVLGLPGLDDRVQLGDIPVSHRQIGAADRGRHVGVRQHGADHRLGLRHDLLRRPVVDT